jgi:hypothetical protein
MPARQHPLHARLRVRTEPEAVNKRKRDGDEENDVEAVIKRSRADLPKIPIDPPTVVVEAITKPTVVVEPIKKSKVVVNAIMKSEIEAQVQEWEAEWQKKSRWEVNEVSTPLAVRIEAPPVRRNAILSC